MSAIKDVQPRLVKPVVIALVGVVVLGLTIFLTIRLVTGRTLGIRSLMSLGLSIMNSGSISDSSRGDFTNIIFLHHSVGRNMVDRGNVREILTKNGYSFWDHDYNQPGLRGPDGDYLGYSYIVPADNTYPDGLAEIFAEPAYSLPLNTFSNLLQHETIIFKPCYPASNITSDEQLEQDKGRYLKMRETMDQYPNKLFIVVTQPPLNPAKTNPEDAARARTLADWLKSEEYLRGHPNIFTFDLFGYLAEDNPASPDYNMLREAYRKGVDSHPNQLANETVGPLFADLIMNAVQTYQTLFPSSSGLTTRQ